MKNNKFIKSTLILIIGGFIIKLLSLLIKIIYTRIVGENAISLYTIITPTYSLIISICASFLPIAISKLVSENKYNRQKLLFNSLFLILIIDIILIIILTLSARTISIYLLKEKRTLYILYAIILTIPFISISSIFKGYFFGIQKMYPNVISNIIEQIIRIILIILIIPRLVKINIVLSVIGLILFNIITEIISCLVFILFLPKNSHINKKNIKISLLYIKKILSISIPLVSARLIGNIGFFLEPILLTNICLKVGFNSNYILSNYGIYNAYAISLLTMPNFFIVAISSSVIPEISKYYAKNNMIMVKKRLNESILFSLLLGLIFCIFIYIFRSPLLYFIYKTTKGSDFIKILSPAFVLFYLEGPLTSSMQATNLVKDSFKITTIGIIIKILVMVILSYLKFGIYALIYAEIINILVVVLLSIIVIKRKLF